MLAITHGQKAGLEGILDPFANGLLIAATNNATRFLKYFLELNKVYKASLKLGTETDTLDLSGKVIKNIRPPLLKKREVEKVLEKFKGRITQKPPVYSNIKINGIPARKLIRKKANIELNSREVMIYDISLIDLSDGLIKFRTSVKSGTYIRSLGKDIAYALGTIGHLESLERVSIGKFSIDDTFSGETIRIKEDEKVLDLYLKEISISEALYWLPQISLEREQILRLHHGQRLIIERKVDEKNLYKVIDPNQQFCGLAFVENGRLIPQKMLPVNL